MNVLVSLLFVFLFFALCICSWVIRYLVVENVPGEKRLLLTVSNILALCFLFVTIATIVFMLDGR